MTLDEARAYIGEKVLYQSAPSAPAFRPVVKGAAARQGRSGGPVLLLDVLAEHREGSAADRPGEVAEGDSFEGSIEYLLPEDEDVPAGSFDVRASYRVGNTMGQGGMRMIGEWREAASAPGAETGEGQSDV